MAVFKMTYIKHGEYDGKMSEDTIEAKDRWDAIRDFRKKNGIRRISDLDYFYAEEVAVRGITCFECTERVDIDGEQLRCGFDQNPLKCSRKVVNN